MSLTFADFLADLRKQAKEQNKDFAWVAQHIGVEPQRSLCEIKVIWIDPPGGFPKEFPPVCTAQEREAGKQWGERWTIERCGIQPRATTVNVKVGKFLPGGMPNIEIPK